MIEEATKHIAEAVEASSQDRQPYPWQEYVSAMIDHSQAMCRMLNAFRSVTDRASRLQAALTVALELSENRAALLVEVGEALDEGNAYAYVNRIQDLHRRLELAELSRAALLAQLDIRRATAPVSGSGGGGASPDGPLGRVSTFGTKAHLQPITSPILRTSREDGTLPDDAVEGELS